MANVMLTIISRSTSQSCPAGMRQLFLSGVITALKVAVLTNFESMESIHGSLDQSFFPLGRHVRRKFHPGHKCHSPHYCGPCLSIRPYLGKSKVKLSHPPISEHLWCVIVTTRWLHLWVIIAVMLSVVFGCTLLNGPVEKGDPAHLWSEVDTSAYHFHAPRCIRKFDQDIRAE